MRILLLSLCFVALGAHAQTLLVGNKAEATVSLIDISSGEVKRTAATGIGPHEIAVSGDGKLAVVANYGAETLGNTLTVIEMPQGEAVGTIDLGKHTRPHGLVFLPDSRHLLVTTEGTKSVLKVDVYLGTVVQRIPTGQRVSHMLAYHPSGQRAFVSNLGSASVSLLDIKNGDLLAFKGSGAGAEGIALSGDGRNLWVTNREEGSVSLFDGQHLTLRDKVEVAGFPIRAELTPDDRFLLVISAKSATLTVIDNQTLTLIKQIDINLSQSEQAADTLFADKMAGSSVPIGVEIAPDGNRAWIAHAGVDRVQEIDLQSWETLRIFATGREPDGMAYSALELSP